MGFIPLPAALAAFLHGATAFAAPESSELANPAIDSAGHRRVVNAALEHRAARRVTEDEFIAMIRTTRIPFEPTAR